MRSVFFGTSEFAVPALHACVAASSCRLVVTQPDRPGGRGQKLQPTPVKRAADEWKIRTLEPVRLRDIRDELAAVEPEVFALASYGKIVPASILALPRVAALNVHPSLLPLYRGATPLQAQLRDGVREGGVTIIAMDAGLDTGDIVLQRKVPIGEFETYGELHKRLAQLGALMLFDALALAARGELDPTPQASLGVDPDAIAATMTRPLRKEDLALDWDWSAQRIVDHVRSLAPQPAARAMLAGEHVKLLRARLTEPNGVSGRENGAVVGVDGEAVLVGCGDGVVAIEQLIPPSRGARSGAAFARAQGIR